jgi:hypothetical protein
MAEVIWVEVQARPSESPVRHRLTQPEIRIGRAYDNDIVLDDPHVAPAHLRLFRDETGALRVEDLGSRNGLYLDRSKTRITGTTLDGTETLRIGRTRLAIRTVDHPVPPELPIIRERRVWPLAILFVLLILGLEMTSAWSNDPGIPNAGRYLNGLLPYLVATSIWTGVWSMISRVFSGTARIERHAVIAFGALFIFSVIDEFGDIGAFAFSAPALASLDYWAGWSLVAIAIYLHLRIVGPGRAALKLSGAVAVAAVAFIYRLIMLSDSQAVIPPSFVHRLLPPSFRATPLKTEDAFLAETRSIKETLDKARSEEPK